MLCPRCQSVRFDEFGDGLVRCVRCRALVAKHEEKHVAEEKHVLAETQVTLPEVNYCDT